MATVDLRSTQTRLDQIADLTRAIESAGDRGRRRLRWIKVEEARGELPLLADGSTLDEKAWSRLGGSRRAELRQHLGTVQDLLREAAGLDGPSDPKHIMSAEYASTRAVWGYACFGLGLTVILLCCIVRCWDGATGTCLVPRVQEAVAALRSLEETSKEATLISKVIEEIQSALGEGATERSVLTMVILLGTLGGSLHLVRSLVMFVGNRQLRRSWLPYYSSMPVTGAGLAAGVYMLLRVGLVSPSGGAAEGAAVAKLNLIAIYAFSLLTGLFARTALDKMSEVFKTLFRTGHEQSKDALGNGMPTGE